MRHANPAAARHNAGWCPTRAHSFLRQLPHAIAAARGRTKIAGLGGRYPRRGRGVVGGSQRGHMATVGGAALVVAWVRGRGDFGVRVRSPGRALCLDHRPTRAAGSRGVLPQRNLSIAATHAATAPIPSILRVVDLTISACCYLAPRAGFEPATNRLTAGCSTAELPGNKGSGSRKCHRI